MRPCAKAARHLRNSFPTVLVMGAGPVGLGVLLAAHALGYGSIDVSEPNTERAELAREFGANIVPTGSIEKRYDLIVECSGNHAAQGSGDPSRAACWRDRSGGRECKTLGDQRRQGFSPQGFHDDAKPSIFPKSEFAENVALLRADRARYARLVDDRFALADLPCKFAEFASGKSIQTNSVICRRSVMASISLRNLVKKYGAVTVIPDLNLEIEDEEFIVLVGPSGCGQVDIAAGSGRVGSNPTAAI